MAKHWCTVNIWILWHFVILYVAAFNLDSQNVLQRNGAPGTLFGFSVAFHQQLSPTKRNLLLVGAPHAKPQNQVNVTGAVYSCDLSTSERCQPIDFNSKEFLGNKGVNNQWMGVRVTSQGPGKNVMTCAHRYQEWSMSSGSDVPNLLTGQCYILGNDLHVREAGMRDRRVLCDDARLKRRSKNHDWFAYCQQGHGASFAKDNVSLLFGAPGAYQWKGIVQKEFLNDLGLISEEPRETGDANRLLHELIPIQKNSYLGFSIDSGMALMEPGELIIVSGAPRGGYSGQVAFIRSDPEAKSNLKVEMVLSGPGLASSFGYDLTVVDLNSDGWEDLAVGAPQYFVKDGEIGGAVFIYINNKGKDWEKTDPIELHGHKDSMFGIAVENAGDINQDGYGDVAVGAPYDGSGRVYLYCGTSDGINREAAQVLSPQRNMVKQFGYSLSGNLDVDNNQYPDLAVGSLSDSVFVFRSKPVVNINTSLRITPNNVDIKKKQCDTQKCYFAGQACFTYTAHPSSFNPKLELSYAFEADYDKKSSRPRVTFSGSSQGKLELPEQGKQVCTDRTLQLETDIKDKLQSIPVSVLVSQLTSSETAGASSDQSPVLSIYHQNPTVSKITLRNQGCGSDNICQSNLQLQSQFCSRTKQNGKDVFTSLVRDNGVAVITPSDDDVALEITVTNRNGDDAHQSSSVIMLPETLHYSSVYSSGDQAAQVSCTANDKGTLIRCELGNPLQRDAEVTFYIILTTSGISLSTKAVNITMKLETTSVQTIQPVELFAKVVFELELQIQGLLKPSQVSLGDVLKGESAVNLVDEIGPAILYEFKITNLGKPLKSFANVSLNIHWPKENSEGKWLLYLTHVSSEGVKAVPCSPANEVNPLRRVKGWQAPSRQRREAKLDALSFVPTKREYKTLTCWDGLRCVEMHCPLLDLDSTAKILLNARLWNTTLAEDYSLLDYLNIVLEASLNLTSSSENIGLKPEKTVTQLKLTVFLETKVEIQTKAAWWIIFLTVVALLLLLALLCYFLWKGDCIHNLANKKFSSS
ncbi:integrin alpha-6 [Nothobranchius furzeri]|uniref:Integrin alpha-6-like n=1 Tax=Nothobranchius furzeri TaxID=105023 RepID=A0A8C6KDY2_NOTFU|nr:integrin alpha-6 [Nothobranchius furzeri]KAF7216298.1 integrin alpha-6-like [Nothobranchius furzeri]